MTPSLTSTYRLQLTPRFRLPDARRAVSYLETLGVSHLYLSPLLAARPGSTHGYDVIDHSRINPELGTDDDLRALAADLASRDMGIVLDIVPNHAAAVIENPQWADLLVRGRDSAYAGWFDVDWDAPGADGRIVLPVLGGAIDEVIGRGELQVVTGTGAAHLSYFDKRFPIAPSTLERARDYRGESLRRLLDAQHYRLTSWRNVQELNYRRFFDVSDLVALRMDSDAVFDATHALVLRWVRDGIVQGLRADHVDGLASPQWYLSKLRAAVDAAQQSGVRAAGEPVAIFVEKILGARETLPADWPVQGTSGYEFMNDVEDLFLDARGYADIEAFYRALRRNPGLRFEPIARDAKRRVLRDALCSDVGRVARLAHTWRPAVSVADAASAIVEVIACLDVYRTYVTEPGVVSEADARVLEAALSAAKESGAPAKGVALLRDAFFARASAPDRVRAELVARFQQTSGPAAAKGVEDTALYVYVPLVSRNEVGGAPDTSLSDAVARVHGRNALRADQWPRSIIATTTHDTKRSADVRSRLSVLTAHAGDWARYVMRWRKLNRRRKGIVGGRPAPDTRTEYLFYQTLVGLWPVERRGRRLDDLPLESWLSEARERLTAYMLKAAREAKTRTSWTERDSAYEEALQSFVVETLHANPDDPFLSDVARLAAVVHDDGAAAALARIAVHCTAPGTTDVYQGDELWNYSLVDPDNRRLVNFAARERLLQDTPDASGVLRGAFAGQRPLSDDSVKAALVATLLRFRRAHAQLMRAGEYVALATHPLDAYFVFARRTRDETCMTFVRTRPPSLAHGPATLAVPRELSGEWKSALTGLTRTLAGGAARENAIADVRDLLGETQPCDVLFRRNG